MFETAGPLVEAVREETARFTGATEVTRISTGSSMR